MTTTPNINDDLDGIEETAGDDALRAAESTERAALAGGADPLDGLLDRIRAEGPAAAFGPAALASLARMRREQTGAWVAWITDANAAAKAGGHRTARTDLTRALDAIDRQHRAEEKRESRRAAAALATAAATARERAMTDAAAAIVRARAEVPDALAAHYGSHAVEDDTCARYAMEPGRVTVERPGRGGRVDVRLLAAFSAVIRRDVHDVDLPGADPRRTFVLGAALPGEHFEQTGEVRADDFAPMRWPEVVFGPRARVMDTGRRDDLRVAIQCMSAPVEVRRFRFTGWCEVDGTMVYLHRSGAIGEGGPVEGLRAEAPAPVDCFDFGDLSIDPARGVAAVLDLLAVESATVVVPLLAASFRAVMGPSRLTLHVCGRMGTGKSMLVGLAAQLFGPTMDADNLPCSWADGSTANGIARVLTRAGDAIVPIDDLRFGGGPGDAATVERFDRVTRAHFNRAAALKLTRDRTERHESASRGTIVSTGETPPRGHSTRDRVVCVELTERPSPELGPLMQRAAAGELARGMASFVQFYAPRVKGNLPRLGDLERAAVVRWGMKPGDRAAKLFGALALGAEMMLAWLEESGVAREDVRRHEQRARNALAAVAREHGEGVEAESPAHRFLPLLREAIRAGEAHIKVATRGGRGGPPPSPESWGWRTDGHDGPKQLGRCVAWIKNGEVLVDRDVALGVVRERAARAGHPFSLDGRTVARDLDAAGLLVRTAMHVAERPTHTVRVSVGGAQVDLLAFTPAVFGIELDACAAAAKVPTDPPKDSPE
jgi:hypothetical protein